MPIAGIQHVLDLHKQYEETRRSTINDLLEQEKGIHDALKALGHDGTSGPATKRPKPKGPCKVCQSPDHDGRFHREKKDSV